MKGIVAMETPGPEGLRRHRHRHRHRRLTPLSSLTRMQSGGSIRLRHQGHRGQRVPAEVEVVVTEMTALEDEATVEVVRVSPLRQGQQLA